MKNKKLAILLLFYLGWILALFRNELSYLIFGYDVALLSNYSYYDESRMLALGARSETKELRGCLEVIGLSLIAVSFVLFLYFLKFDAFQEIKFVLYLMVGSSFLFLLWPYLKLLILFLLI